MDQGRVADVSLYDDPTATLTVVEAFTLASPSAAPALA
jgi:hypothetical protein